jgi:hypothetical protein
MKLLQNEEGLISSNAGKINLTTHRIFMKDEIWGNSYSISIFLEDISSVEIKFKSNPLFVILGALVILVGLLTGKQFLIGGIVVGCILIAIWWFTRKHVIIVSSNGGSQLSFIVEGMSEEKINDFTDSIQEAKLKRVNQLYKG